MDNTRKAALISFLVSVLILGLKFWAYAQTSSAAILSDAMESIVNVVAAAVALLVMRAVAEPADEEHPYGHGKLEYFSAAFEGGLITFAGIVIAYEAICSIFRGQPPTNLDFGMFIAASGAVGNLVLGVYLLRVGRRKNSETLMASGKHVLSDVWSTVGVFVGLVLVRLTGWAPFDGIAALLISFQLAYAGFKIVRGSLGALIDEASLQTLKDLAYAFEQNRHPGVIDLHLVKVIRSGNFHHIDGHLVVPEFWQIKDTHELLHNFENKVVKTYPFDGEINFHLDPCDRAYCSQCDLPECPVRQREFKKRRVFTAASLQQKAQKDPE